jgi:hypothetical protein
LSLVPKENHIQSQSADFDQNTKKVGFEVECNRDKLIMLGWPNKLKNLAAMKVLSQMSQLKSTETESFQLFSEAFGLDS